MFRKHRHVTSLIRPRGNFTLNLRRAIVILKLNPTKANLKALSAHAHLLFDCGDQWNGVPVHNCPFVYEDGEMAMAKAAPVPVAIDCDVAATAAITVVAVVICVVEEPVDTAA